VLQREPFTLTSTADVCVCVASLLKEKTSERVCRRSMAARRRAITFLRAEAASEGPTTKIPSLASRTHSITLFYVDSTTLYY